MQTNENQKLAINKYCEACNLCVDEFISETKSGTTDYKKRKLGPLTDRLQEGDTIIVTELSRLGRSLLMIFDILQVCMLKKVKVIAIKNNFTLQDDIQSKVLAFAFGLSAEIERNLISERTKQGLERARLQGKKIGSPKGSKKYKTKLRRYENQIRKLYEDGVSIQRLAKLYEVHWSTMKDFVENRMNMKKPKQKKKKY